MSETARGGDGTVDSRESFPTVLGCAFCGGRSRRMGRDKALLPIGAGTLLERSVRVLGEVCSAGVLLASGSADRYPWLSVPSVADRIPDGGPLAGLEAALSWMVAEASGVAGALGNDGPAEWLLVLACDMPLVEPADLRGLITALGAADADAVLVQGPNGPEPLFACYHRRTLPAVRAALERGERRMVAFHDEVRVRTHVPAAGRHPLRNVNTPEDWSALGERELPA